MLGASPLNKFLSNHSPNNFPRSSSHLTSIATDAVGVVVEGEEAGGLTGKTETRVIPSNSDRRSRTDQGQSRIPHRIVLCLGLTKVIRREIPGMKPWVLVTTKQGRKFVHNTETKASLWKAPDDVQAAIDRMSPEEDKSGELKKGKCKKVTALGGESRAEVRSEQEERRRAVSAAAAAVKMEEGGGEVPDRENATLQGQEEDQEEEDEEDEGDEGEEEMEEYAQKKLKTLEQGPLEFTEDDVAWQLEAMAQEYGLDEEDLDEGEEMTDEDNIYLFKVCIPQQA